VVCLSPMASTERDQPKTFTFRELTVWTSKLPDVSFGVLPPSNTRPNPLATEDLVYASVFAPGAICALERDGGTLIWRRELHRYANASVHLHDGKLFAKTCNTLFALQPDSGEILWSFCPYGTEGEWIYSSPSAYEDRVYIGDRRGWLHCLDGESGRTIWRRHTNRARNCDVNSTPVLIDGLAIVSTNAKSVVAYDAQSGRLAWKQKLDGPSTFGPLVHRNSVLTVSDSLCLLNPGTGEVEQLYSWKKEKVYRAETTPRTIVLTFWPKWASCGNPPPNESDTNKITILITKSGVQRTTTFVAFCHQFRYIPATALLYLSHAEGIDLIHPEDGRVLCQLKTTDDTRGGLALVDVRDGLIYALSGDGSVYALRHPLSAANDRRRSS